jgi:hypothetical protein
MSSKKFTIEEVCRLNGKRPSMRSYWIAFYRLWRITQRADTYPAFAAEECLQLMFHRNIWSRWRLLVSSPGETIGIRKALPVCVRKQLIDSEKSRRESKRANRLMKAIMTEVTE